MSTPNLFRDSGSYLALNLEERFDEAQMANRHAPAITIARQTGARGVAICTRLHQALSARDARDPLDWKLFDSELSKEVLRDHGLPLHLERFIPDDKVSEYEGMINELLGGHPSLWQLFKDTQETISKLSRIGHCILVGRGSNYRTRSLSHVLNVRLMGTIDVRAKQLAKSMQISEAKAKALIKDEDHARASYVKHHYHADINNPGDYDLVINTDHLSDERVVSILMEALPVE